MMERRKRNVIAAGLSNLNLASSGDLIEGIKPSAKRTLPFPTPTSLESFSASPWDQVKPADIFSPAAIDPQVVIPVNHLEDNIGIPLLHAPITQTLDFKKSIVCKARRKREICSDRMLNTRVAERKSLFGPLNNCVSASLGVEDSISSAIKKLNAAIPSSLPMTAEGPPRTALLESLLYKSLPFDAAHADCYRDYSAYADEMRGALPRLFYPATQLFKAQNDKDCAFMAYSIANSYFQGSKKSLFRRDSRCYLYVAALMLAFKFLEEEDPRPKEFFRLAQTHTGMPIVDTYISRRASQMEQRIMMSIDWRLASIPTPIILANAILDNISFLRPMSFVEKCTAGQSISKLLSKLLTLSFTGSNSKLCDFFSQSTPKIIATLLTVVLGEVWKVTTQRSQILLMKTIMSLVTLPPHKIQMMDFEPPSGSLFNNLELVHRIYSDYCKSVEETK